jgi:uncharacterized protein (TIGR00269 family)
MRDRVRSFLNWYSVNRPEALFSLLNNFEKLILGAGYGSEQACELCGEPSSRRLCRACELEQRIRDALKA